MNQSAPSEALYSQDVLKTTRVVALELGEPPSSCTLTAKERVPEGSAAVPAKVAAVSLRLVPVAAGSQTVDGWVLLCFCLAMTSPSVHAVSSGCPRS